MTMASEKRVELLLGKRGGQMFQENCICDLEKFDSLNFSKVINKRD